MQQRFLKLGEQLEHDPEDLHVQVDDEPKQQQ